MVQEADMTHEALHNVTREERRLMEYISIMKATFNAMDGEANEAKAAVAVAQAELVGELGFTFFVP